MKIDLAQALAVEVARWSTKTYAELAALEYPDTYEVTRQDGGLAYQVEVSMLERRPEYIQISVAVDDGGIRAFFPRSESVIAYSTK
jgi:hypothetical protein